MKLNRFESKGKEVFQPLKNLMSLELSLNELYSLDSGMFAYMPHLTELDLSSNELSIQKETLFHLNRLRKLNLSGNRVGLSLGDEIFSTLSSLEELKLDENNIKTIYGEMFKGLENLKEIYLRNKSLEIEKDAFSLMKNLEMVYLYRALKKNVENIELGVRYPNFKFEYHFKMFFLSFYIIN